jgi:hypothetical protein
MNKRNSIAAALNMIHLPDHAAADNLSSRHLLCPKSYVFTGETSSLSTAACVVVLRACCLRILILLSCSSCRRRPLKDALKLSGTNASAGAGSK